MVNGPHSIWVERRGKLLRTDAGFVDDQHLLRIIDKIISRIGRRIDEASPMVDARLPDGSRVNAIIPPLAVTGPTLTIRKFRRDPLTMEDLLRFGTLTPRAAQLLEACVRGKLNILISGGTGSGKTTTLNVLSAAIPEGERIVTVEDAAELQLRQEHVITLESRPANIEGKGLVSIRDLVRNCLRMRPDRIIVGECRGPETIDMLQAMNTGHDGSLTTIHANTPRDALSRVETLVLTGGVELPLKAIREQIASAFDMVVQVSRLVDGTRRITHITEVLRMESDVVTLQDLFIAKPLEDGEEAAAAGSTTACSARCARAASSRSSSPSSARTACTCRRSSSSSSPSAARQRAGAPDGVRQGLGMRRALVVRSGGLAAVLAVAVGASGAAHAARADRAGRHVALPAHHGDRDRARTATSCGRIDARASSENGTPVRSTTQTGGRRAGRDRRRARRQPLDGGRAARCGQAGGRRRSSRPSAPTDSMALYSFGHTRESGARARHRPDVLARSLQQLGARHRPGHGALRLRDPGQRASSRDAPTLTKVLVVLTDGDDTTKTKLGDAVKRGQVGRRHGRRDRASARPRRPRRSQSLARQTGGHVFAADRSAAGHHAPSTGRSPRRSATPTASSTRSHGDGVVPLEVEPQGLHPGARRRST